MRNLKRALSLALASVMLLGMMVVGTSAAAYPDVDSQDNLEAIEVLKAVGVMTGDEKGNFNPDADVTRNEMAVIMCSLLDLTPGGSHPFNDVPQWASPYVAACYNNGIIAGVSATQFNGDATVTAVQAGLMCMKPLGYFSYAGEFGDNWKIATVKQADKISLYKGINYYTDQVMTRNDVAQLVLNTLESDVVVITEQGGLSVDGNGISVNVKPTYSSPVTVKNKGKEDYRNDGDDLQQLCEKLYGADLTKDGSAQDDFNRPTNDWHYNDTTISALKAPTVSYTKEVKIGDIYKDLGLGKKIDASDVTFSVNGKTEAASGSANNGSPAPALTAVEIAKNSETKIGGNGIRTEVVYDKTAGTAEITLVSTYAGKVTSVRAATSSKDASVTITPLNAGNGGSYDTEAFEVDDIVLYTYSEKTNATGVKDAVLAEQITGNLDGYTAGKKAVIDGKTYDFNKAATINLGTGNVDKEVTVTLDANGYVVDIDTDVTSNDYAVILRYADKGTFDDARAELLFADGTTETVDLKDNVAGANAGDIVTYKVNNKDKYELTIVQQSSTATASSQVTTKNSSAINNVASGTAYGNGKTIYLVATKTGSDTKYTSYVGFANVPTVKVGSDNCTATVYCKSGQTATLVYIDATGTGAASSSSTKEVVFVKGSNDGSSYNGTLGTYWTYDAIVNDEITEINTSHQITSDTMYTIISKDGNDVYTLSGALTIKNPANTADGGWGEGTDKAENGSVTLGVQSYSVADDCKVYYINVDGDISTSSLGSIQKDNNDKVWFKLTNEEVTTIVYRYVEDVDGQMASGSTSSEIEAELKKTGVNEVVVADANMSSTLTVPAGKTVVLTGNPTGTVTTSSTGKVELDNITVRGTLNVNATPKAGSVVNVANGGNVTIQGANETVINTVAGANVTLGSATTELPKITGNGTVTLTTTATTPGDPTEPDDYFDDLMAKVNVPKKAIGTGNAGVYTVAIDQSTAFTANGQKIQSYSNDLTLTQIAEYTGGNASSAVSFHMVSIPKTALSAGCTVKIEYKTTGSYQTLGAADKAAMFGSYNGTAVSADTYNSLATGETLDVILPLCTNVTGLQVTITPAP